MKTDSLFYELFRLLPNVLLELLGEDPGRADGYHFSSVELKQPAFRVDGILEPNEDSPQKEIYFLEVQFQKKRDFYWRLFSEIFLYLRQKKPRSNWRAVALFARKSIDPGLPIQFEALRRNHLSVVYLDELASASDLSPGLSLVQLIVASQRQAIKAGKRLREKLEREPGGDPVSQVIIELMEAILLYKFPNMSREEIEAMFQLEGIRKSRVYQEALAEGRIEGEREGEIKGKREGEIKGKLETVPLLVQLGLNEEVIAQELGLDPEAVRKAAAKAKNRRPKPNGAVPQRS